MYRIFLELAGYGVASAFGLLVDVAILRTLVKEAGWHYLPASVIAFTAGAGVVYAICVRFVFRSRSSHHRAIEFSYFLLLGVVGLLVNAAALAVAIDALGVALIPAKLIAAVCTFITNFTLRRQLLFVPTEASR